MATISLPTKDRSFAPYTTGEPIVLPRKGAAPKFNRVAYAAAHVVADPLADNDPWLDARSTGTRPSRSANICGTSASASPKRWTPRSAAWASTGTARRS